MMKFATFVFSLFYTAFAFGAEATINVDFQPGPNGSSYSANFHGQGGLSDPGNDTWNAVMPPVDGYASAWGSGGNFNFESSFVSDPLFDSAGGITPVTVTIHRGKPLGTTFAVNPSNVWAFDHVAVDAKNLMSDYLIAPGNGTNSIRINHLVPKATYTLYLYGAGDQNTHQTTFTVDSISQTTAGVPHEIHPMAEGADYVVFRDVEAADGTLVIYYSGAGASGDGNFNGFQIRGMFLEIKPPVIEERLEDGR